MSDPKQVYERHIAAFNARDGDADPWTDGAEFVAPGSRMRGKDEILAFYAVFWEAFPDARNDVDRLVAEGSLIAAEGRFSGTHNGTLRMPEGDVPATGRRVELRWVAVCEAREEQLASENLYFDRLELMTQLGADQVGSAPATSG